MVPTNTHTKKKYPALQIASWNVRTMQTGLSGDLEEVTDAPKTSIIDRELNRLNIDIAGLQETRLADFGSIKEKNYTFFWQGLQEEEKRLYGVGFAIRNKLLSKMEPIKQGSERMLLMRLRTSSGFATFVCCYAPTLASDSDFKERFYSQLDDIIKNVKSSDALYLLGDFNARVGAEKCLWPEVLGSHGTGKMNENGQRLLEFCSYHHLCITNTFFENKSIHKGTWRHPRSKTWHQIDFTITKQSNMCNIKNSRTYHSADCNTDHSLVRSKITLVPKAIHKSKKKVPPKIDISKATNKKWKIKFHNKFKSTYKTLPDDDTNATDTWKYLQNTIHRCALETFGTKRGTIGTGTKLVLRRLNLFWRENVMQCSNSRPMQIAPSRLNIRSSEMKHKEQQGNVQMSISQHSPTRFNVPQTPAISEQCMKASTKLLGNKSRSLLP